MGETSKIDSFTNQFYFLSNFAPVKVILDGIKYPSVEHAYQAAKTKNKDDRLKILTARSPAVAKRYGQKVKKRDDWEEVKVSVMEELVTQKFKTNKAYRALLLATEDRLLEEGNWWGDTFWGVCKGEGRNELGKLLMRVRDKIKKKEQEKKK